MTTKPHLMDLLWQADCTQEQALSALPDALASLTNTKTECLVQIIAGFEATEESAKAPWTLFFKNWDSMRHILTQSISLGIFEPNGIQTMRGITLYDQIEPLSLTSSKYMQSRIFYSYFSIKPNQSRHIISFWTAITFKNKQKVFYTIVINNEDLIAALESDNTCKDSSDLVNIIQNNKNTLSVEDKKHLAECVETIKLIFNTPTSPSSDTTIAAKHSEDKKEDEKKETPVTYNKDKKIVTLSCGHTFDIDKIISDLIKNNPKQCTTCNVPVSPENALIITNFIESKTKQVMTHDKQEISLIKLVIQCMQALDPLSNETLTTTYEMPSLAYQGYKSLPLWLTAHKTHLSKHHLGSTLSMKQEIARKHLDLLSQRYAHIMSHTNALSKKIECSYKKMFIDQLNDWLKTDKAQAAWQIGINQWKNDYTPPAVNNYKCSSDLIYQLNIEQYETNAFGQKKVISRKEKNTNTKKKKSITLPCSHTMDALSLITYLIADNPKECPVCQSPIPAEYALNMAQSLDPLHEKNSVKKTMAHTIKTIKELAYQLNMFIQTPQKKLEQLYSMNQSAIVGLNSLNPLLKLLDPKQTELEPTDLSYDQAQQLIVRLLYFYGQIISEPHDYLVKITIAYQKPALKDLAAWLVHDNGREAWNLCTKTLAKPIKVSDPEPLIDNAMQKELSDALAALQPLLISVQNNIQPLTSFTKTELFKKYALSPTAFNCFNELSSIITIIDPFYKQASISNEQCNLSQAQGSLFKLLNQYRIVIKQCTSKNIINMLKNQQKAFKECALWLSRDDGEQAWKDGIKKTLVKEPLSLKQTSRFSKKPLTSVKKQKRSKNKKMQEDDLKMHSEILDSSNFEIMFNDNDNDDNDEFSEKTNNTSEDQDNRPTAEEFASLQAQLKALQDQITRMQNKQ